jgi:UDP-N-acetylmuramoyl-tripeptide--D-alanyl-D-alanine ligase
MTVRPLTLSDAALAYGGTLIYPDCRFSAVSTDTRALGEGDLFVALKGEHFDAHDFLESAALDACGLVVERPDKRLNLPQWVVPDTTAALADLGRLARDQFAGPLVAITGSSGKTTVKEMIAAILSRCGPTHATRGNLNNHIGVPLTLLALQRQHKYAVVEMGASGPGEIAYLCDIARPRVGLVNNVMPAHLGGFGSLEAIAATKGDIYRALPPTGIAVLNLDEPWCDLWQREMACSERLTYALTHPDADFTARFDNGKRGNSGTGVRFTLVTPKGEAPVSLPLPGRHNVANALAAAACAMAAGADLEAVVAGLISLDSFGGRMQLRAGRDGIKVIDDTYNANPGSVKAAIDVLADQGGETVLVLGEMAELGTNAARLHNEVGGYARERGIRHLLAVGEHARSIVAGFGGGDAYADKAALLDDLLAMLDGDVTVLVKGSRSAAMEDIVNRLVEGES